MDALGVASILLADWVDSAQNFVQVFTLVYFLLIFGYILMSWIRMPYSIWMQRIQRFLYDVVEPYLRIFRRFIRSARWTSRRSWRSSCSGSSAAS